MGPVMKRVMAFVDQRAKSWTAEGRHIMHNQ
jgi:hypothetical protein